ncbi:pejvakin-like [Watersipora subatra]|uniref:pejvakin-like n=1 Tax=Watersipora subatra TaxID=2589382 RepID=UPI00355BDBDE
MFNVAVNNLVESIGADVYLPSPSTAASKNLAPLSLVERKQGILPFSRYTDYHTTDFTLNDVLTDQSVEFKLEPDQPFCTFNRESTVKVDGELQGSLKGIFDAGVQLVDSITIKAMFGALSITEVDLQFLLNELANRKLNMSHGLVSQLASKKRKALCVVTGVVKTIADTSITAQLNQSVHMHLADSDNEEEEAKGAPEKKSPLTDILSSDIVEGELRGVHEEEGTRSLSLPAGTVVAYEIAELAVSESGALQLMLSHGSKGGFHKKLLGNKLSNTSSSVKKSLKHGI